MSEETQSARNLREALEGESLDVLALLVRHRGYEMLLGWNGERAKWEAFGEDEGDQESETRGFYGVGASIAEALDACADALDREFAEIDDGDGKLEEFCPGCGAARDELCGDTCNGTSIDDERGGEG